MENKLQGNHGIRVLLDTNFLLLPFQRRIDVFEEIPQLVGGHIIFLILPQILKELEWLKLNGTKKEQNAVKNSLKLLHQYCQIIEDLPPSIQNLDADSAILQYAQEVDVVVATNDRELRRKLIKQGSHVIFLRKLAILEYTG